MARRRLSSSLNRNTDEARILQESDWRTISVVTRSVSTWFNSHEHGDGLRRTVFVPFFEFSEAHLQDRDGPFRFLVMELLASPLRLRSRRASGEQSGTDGRGRRWASLPRRRPWWRTGLHGAGEGRRRLDRRRLDLRLKPLFGFA